MADYRILTGRLPNDGSSDEGFPRHLGIQFNVTEIGYDLTELSFYVPAPGMHVLTTALVQLWNLTTAAKLAEVNLLALPAGDPDTWMRATIPRVVPNLAHTYLACFYTVGTPGVYVWGNTGIFPVVSGPLTATTSLWSNAGTPDQVPTNTYDGYYLVDVTATPSAISGTIDAATSPGAISLSGQVFSPDQVSGTLTAVSPLPRIQLSAGGTTAAPDLETVLLLWLRSRPELTGIRFGTLRPARFTSLPYVQITRTGGAASLPTWRPGPQLDRAAITVQVWAAPDLAATRAACTKVLNALYALRSRQLGPLTVVRVQPLAGLSPLPDPAAPDGVHRATASVLVTSR